MADEPNTPDQEVDDEALTATQGLIARLSEQLDGLKTKQKEFKDMHKGVLDNDEKLAEIESKAEEANQAIKSRKADINQTQEVMDIKMKITDVTEDIKLVQESLNTHLLNYFQMTNSTTVDMPDGSERPFTVKATLKPKRKS